MEDATWIVVANATVARIWESLKGGPLEDVVSWAHVQGKLVEAGSHPAMENPVGAREEEMVQFARLLAAELDRHFREKAYSKLYLAAGPQFLGILRAQLSAQVASVVAEEIAKDLTHDKVDAIRDYLPPVI